MPVAANPDPKKRLETIEKIIRLDMEMLGRQAELLGALRSKPYSEWGQQEWFSLKRLEKGLPVRPRIVNNTNSA